MRVLSKFVVVWKMVVCELTFFVIAFASAQGSDGCRLRNESEYLIMLNLEVYEAFPSLLSSTSQYTQHA